MTDIAHELNEIQALVRGFRRDVSHARFLYIQINDQVHGRRFLAWLMSLNEDVQTLPTDLENKQKSDDEVYWNIAFTGRGLENLGVSANVVETFPVEFKQGMAYRAEDNGDVGRSDPQHWDPYWLDRGVDIWLGLYSRSPAALGTRIAEIEAFIAGANTGINPVIEIAHIQQGERQFLGNTRVYIDDPNAQPTDPDTLMEHFGFNDGVSSPAIEGIWDNTHPSPDSHRVNGNGKFENGRWSPLAPGEFVLGHVDEVDEIPIAPIPRLLSHNGSFLVLRKLYQDVDTFRQYVVDTAARYGSEVTADYIAAKMVGRNRDGSNFLDSYRINNFLFDKDPGGGRCPLGAHIRRANPRDSLGFESLLVNRHRLARRAITFGPLVPAGESAIERNGPNALNPDGEGQGLLFVAICASISRQFEFIQRQWINFGNDLDQGDDRDPIIGNNLGSVDSRMTIPANEWVEPGRPPANQPAVSCPGLPSFVETRGGDYFFLPSISALLGIAKGSFIEPEFDEAAVTRESMSRP